MGAELKMAEEKKSKVPDKIKGAIDAVLELLNSDRLPEVVSKVVFPSESKPCSAWSVSNQLICIADWIKTNVPAYSKAKTSAERSDIFVKNLSLAVDKMDYRGFNQWKEAKRHILKGKVATYILAPMPRKITEAKEKKTGERLSYDKDSKGYYKIGNKGEKIPVDKDSISFSQKFIVSGFRAVPVFDIKSTEGKPVKYTKLKLPQMPFLAVAEHLGIKVRAQGFRKGQGYYAAFSPRAREIILCTPDQSTFFHELAHAVDDMLMKQKTGRGLKGGQHADQEIVAQLSANVLSYIVGYRIKETTSYTKKYIGHYSGGDEKSYEEIVKVISRVEGVVDFISNFKQAESPSRQMEKKTGEPPSDAEKLADNPPKANQFKISESNDINKLKQELYLTEKFMKENNATDTSGKIPYLKKKIKFLESQKYPEGDKQ